MNEISDNLLFRRSLLPLLDSALDAAALRQKAIANNVANAEVDGYQRRVVEFEEQLKEALEENRSGEISRTHPEHLPHPGDAEVVQAKLSVDENTDYFNGHNNIDIDREMTELARVMLTWRFETRVTQEKFSSLRLAITGQD